METLQALNPGVKYSFLNAGVHPSYKYIQDDLAVNLGVEAAIEFR